MKTFNKLLAAILLLAGMVSGNNSFAQKPIVWVITDGSDKSIINPETGRFVGDPDDISALAGYLLMSNMFDTRGIVVASKGNLANLKAPDQKKWAEGYFGKAYASDLPI